MFTVECAYGTDGREFESLQPHQDSQRYVFGSIESSAAEGLGFDLRGSNGLLRLHAATVAWIAD